MIPAITFHKPPAGRPCTHAAYLLECPDFDELRARSVGRCEICFIPEDATPHGILHIDHDSSRGQWAVRGLLCSRCNTLLERGLISGPALDRYLANAWWKHKLRRLGLDRVLPQEPPIGTWVRGPLGRIWLRIEAAWDPPVHRRKRGFLSWQGAQSWRDLHHYFGPHNIVIDPEVGELVKRLKRTARRIDAQPVVDAIEYGLRQVDIAKLASCTENTVYLLARAAGLPLKREATVVAISSLKKAVP